MTNYYEVLKVKSTVSKQNAFRAFKKGYRSSKSLEEETDRLTALLIILNERQKFLDVLLKQSLNNQPLAPKYLRIIDSERGIAQTMLESSEGKNKLEKALFKTPTKELGLEIFSFLLSSSSSRSLLSLVLFLYLIGPILFFQNIEGPNLKLLGTALIISGVILHRRVLADIQIDNILNSLPTTTYINHD